MVKPGLFLALALVCLGAPVLAAESGHQHHTQAGRADCPPGETALRCARQVSPAFLPDGSLVIAWSAGGRVMLARSTDQGASLSGLAMVNAAAEAIDESGDARPAVAADRKGRVYVAYALRKDAAYSGTLMLGRSRDGGASFFPPKAVASDKTSQRFPAMMVDGKDRLTLAWIDKRGIPKAKAEGKSYTGAALALAWSDDGGDSFAFEGVAEDHSCECCRIGLALDAAGRPVVLWRHVFAPNIRDHAVMTFTDRHHRGQMRRLSEDDWRVDACPHHGPALAVAADGSVHAAWFTAGTKRKGLFYARALGSDAAFSEPRAIGNAEHLPAHAQILAQGGVLWLAWKEFDGERTTVQVQASRDSGQTWTEPRVIASTADASDRPILTGDGKRAYLSWMTQTEGWRLIPLEAAP